MPKRSFDEWKVEVDKALLRLIGLDSDCLPDYDYKGAYEANKLALTTANVVIRLMKGW